MKGGIIGVDNTPTTSVASGVWRLNEVYKYVDAGLWPVPFGISYIGSESNNTDNVASMTLNIPTGTADGDLILFMGSCDGTVGYAMPSGFTQIGSTQVVSSHADCIGYKIANSEPSNYTVSTISGTERGIGFFAVYRNVNPDDPINSYSYNGASTGNTTAIFTALTPDKDNCAVIAFVGAESGNDGYPFVSSWPSTIVEINDNVNGPPGTADASSAGAFGHVIQSTAAQVTGSADLTDTGTTYWGAFLIALNFKTTTMEYIGSAVYETSHTSYTFSSQSYGGTGLIIVAISSECATSPAVPSITSVTIGGNTMTEVETVVSSLDTSTSDCIVALYSYVMTSGTSADIVVNHGTSMFRTGIGVWRITGYSSVTSIDTQTDTSNTSSTSDAVVMTNLVNEAVMIAAFTSSGNLTGVTWTNATERYDAMFTGGSHGSGADAVSTGTSDVTITVSYSTTTERQALVGAAWH